MTEEYGSLNHKNPAKSRVYGSLLFVLPCFHSVKELSSPLKFALKIVQNKGLNL
ncbi:hypothetical protein SynSYN20_01973 [Synechococcus sp. SYN20]|nr:hypothetical protein SynSYN20_01973 [Synechococcus sp. SYN20]